jgi:hypothetical protein
MPKLHKITKSVNAGELSPKMQARDDQQKYASGAKIMENFFPLVYGGAQRRPGTEYIATQKDVSAKGRSIEFEHSVDDTYNLVFENLVIRVFKDGDRVMDSKVDVSAVTLAGTDPVEITTLSAHGMATGDVVRFNDLDGGVDVLNYVNNDATEWAITVIDADEFSLDDTDSSDYTAWIGNGQVASILEVVTPYLTADLPALKTEQSADVMFIAHPSYESRRLERSSNTDWTLTVAGLLTGPFRPQNVDTTHFITASDTTGTVTLTATGSGNQPFVTGITAGHSPSGALATSKAQTGALFQFIHASNIPSVSKDLDSAVSNDATAEITVPKGVTWDFITNGSWGAGGSGATIVLERSYDGGGLFETVSIVTSVSNSNIISDGTEDFSDAVYRARVSVASGTGKAMTQISIRDTSHIGTVRITSVASVTVATGEVVRTLGSTQATHRWSEGSFSNFRGWPIDVTISAEERLTFTGNIAEPLTVWGSVISDFTDFALGTDDSDAIQFTLVGTGQQNRIRWTLGKDALVLGTVGGEHLLGASKQEEALTPTNVKAKLQTTYGSEDLAAILVNQAVLFLQRGGKKIREFLYNFDTDSFKADDLTVFSDQITGDGIVDMAFQRTPDPRLWCVRSDGEMAVLVYERDQNVFSWSRYVTGGQFESVSVIYGGERAEDEVWVTVKRELPGVSSSPVRYIERFTAQGVDQVDEAVFLDAAKVSTASFSSNNIILASDTIRCNEGLCNSSLCGGVIS